MLEPTRGGDVLDLVLSSQKELINDVRILEPLGNRDHSQIHLNLKINSGNGQSKPKQLDFHRGDYINIIKYLQDKKWNKLLENKTTDECWDIVKKELEFMINKFVPVKSQKRTRKKHLSKDALKTIRNKRRLKIV